MKISILSHFLFYSLILLTVSISAQPKVENVIIITLDGMRWQEVFTGADTAIVKNPKFNQESSDYILKKYSSRQNLMPFLWSIVAQKGQLYGNRKYGNLVNVSNPYWVSYPGYSEIFCGLIDTNIRSNKFVNNSNTNFLEILNQHPAYKNKVAIFGAWAAFPYILNISRNKLPISSDFNPKIPYPTQKEKFIYQMLQQSFKPWGEGECLDVFTHFQAIEYLKTRKPKVLFIGYGETDEWAHAGKYKYYLDAAHQTDRWIAEIWNFRCNGQKVG